MRRALAQASAVTGVDWRSLYAMPVDMFNEFVDAVKAMGDG
jgi:hypothetical protein